MSERGSSRARGRAVEDLVADYLERQGLRILDRNVELAAAELDIVALDDRTREGVYVFVEVRSRRTDERGTPIETIGAQKQGQVVRAATTWLVRENLWERVAVRFDVVGVVTEGPNAPIIEWIEDAFGVSR